MSKILCTTVVISSLSDQSLGGAMKIITTDEEEVTMIEMAEPYDKCMDRKFIWSGYTDVLENGVFINKYNETLRYPVN